MTDHRHHPATDPEAAIRRALHDAVADLPYVPGLVTGMHLRAARIRRRRATTATAALATGLVAFGVLVTSPYGNGAAPAAPSVRPVPPPALTAPARPEPEPEPTLGPPTAAASAEDPRGGTGPDPGPQPRSPQGTAVLDDRFDGAGLDRARWVPYDGPAQPVGRWDPGALTVRDGTLRVTVRTGTSASDLRNGGLKSVVTQRDGRWQVRWRLTPGRGVIAQFVLIGDGPGGVRYAATLDPDAGTLTLSDTVGDDAQTVRVDAGRFHTVALERSPTGVRWSLDGDVVAEHPADPRRTALLLGLQAFVADAGCVDASPCAGPDSAVLEVDRASVRPLRD